MATDPSSTPDPVDQLKRAWGELTALDRARAVSRIRNSGISIRQIAKQIGKSESLLRHLLKALKAPAADQAAARQGTLSTNELVRRAKTAASRLSAQRRKADESIRERKATHGAKLICDWLQEHRMAGAYGEQIIDEARRIIISALHAGSLPHVIPPRHPVSPAVIIERCKPKESLTDDIHRSGWYSAWLARWIVFAFPHPDVRDKALHRALESQWKR